MENLPDSPKGPWWGIMPSESEWQNLRESLNRRYETLNEGDTTTLDFRGIVLTQFDLGRTKFLDVDLSYANFTEAQFSSNRDSNREKGRGTTLFKNCTFKNTKFNKIEFRYTFFEGCTLKEDTEFIEAKMSGVSMRDCILEKICFHGSTLNNIALNSVSFKNCEFHSITWQEQKPAQAINNKFDDVKFELCKFIHANMIGSYLPDGIFFIECEFSNDTNLNFAIFNKCDLFQCVFKGTHLGHTRFLNSRLNDSRMECAILQGASFGGPTEPTEIPRVSFSNSDTRRINLEFAVGLESTQLKGLDLNGAVLPRHIADFPVKDAAAKAAGYARKLFTPIVLFCMFIVACSFLLSHDHKVKILNFDLQVTADTLAWCAPVILIMWQSVFLFYTNRLWETVERLPAVFPDGSKIYEYPDLWLPINYTRLENHHFSGQSGSSFKDRLRHGRWRAWLAVVFLWFVVPIALLLSAIGFYRYGNTGLNLWLFFMFLSSLVQAFWSQNKAAELLGGKGWCRKLDLGGYVVLAALTIFLTVIFLIAAESWYSYVGSILY